MSVHVAPIYTRSFEVSRALHQRIAAWPAPVRDLLGRPTTDASRDLMCAAAEALTFPARRREAAQEADRALLRLREHLRLAHALRAIDETGLLALCDELATIGKMLGGWQRRLAKSSK